MNIKRLFVTLFRAIDCLNEEKPNKDMQCFLADANPYLFKDRNAAVADVQHSFEDFIGNVDFKDISSLYDIVYNYLKVNYSCLSMRFIQSLEPVRPRALWMRAIC